MCVTNKVVDIWQETFQVRFGDIDCSDRLTLASVFDFFQEVAISHAENLGVGRASMAQSGQVWLLSRMSVQVDRRPRYDEAITVRTWPRGGEKLFAMRDFDIRDAQDTPVVRATSGWLVIDMEKRRPLRPQAIMDKLPQNEGISAGLEALVGLTECPGLQKTADQPAAYSDLDFNNHVNNVRYIEWIQDVLDPDLLTNADQIRIDINYLNEALPGEVIEMWTGNLAAPLATENDNAAKVPKLALAVEGRRAGGPTAFRAEVRVW